MRNKILEKQSYVLLVKCPDCPGLIHKITGSLYEFNLNIISNDEYVAPLSQTFFNRANFTGSFDKNQLIVSVKSKLSADAEINLIENKEKEIVVMVTKEHHCLGDLLIRNEYNELDAKIKAVIGNHETLRHLVEKFNIPYHYISTQNLDRESHENEVMKVIDMYNFDYLILAKYMRILTENFVNSYTNKIINIHHSFLPAFIGANPYRQAYNRGVKIIGATAHFVTKDLDEGPIIEQGVHRINHHYSVKQMTKAGHDIERDVLSGALKKVFENRVMINGKKTIVF